MKTKSEYFDPRRGQLVADQSSPSRVALHISVTGMNASLDAGTRWCITGMNRELKHAESQNAN